MQNPNVIEVLASWLTHHTPLAGVIAQIVVATVQTGTIIFVFVQFFQARRTKRQDDIRSQFFALLPRVGEVINDNEIKALEEAVSSDKLESFVSNTDPDVTLSADLDPEGFIDRVNQRLQSAKKDAEKYKFIESGSIRRRNLFQALDYLRKKASRDNKKFLQTALLAQLHDKAVRLLVCKAFINKDRELLVVLGRFGAPFEAAAIWPDFPDQLKKQYPPA
jgi:hypothetical protein